MLKVKNLGFAYKQKTVLKKISFELDYGQSVCLLGQNGVGKSTLFKCLLGILKPASGTISMDGQALAAFSRSELSRQIAYIPQNQKNIVQFTVFEMVLMGTTAGLKPYQQPGKVENERAEAALELLNITHLKNRLYAQISGGEQQLAIIARSVAQQSKIIIMDEPCASLDYGNQVLVLKMIQKLAAKGYLIIQSTHDPNHALQYADTVLILQEGYLSAQGKPNEILTSQQLEGIYQVPVMVHQLPESQQQVCVPQ
jgi:iron complex transport system ATP-binding protein